MKRLAAVLILVSVLFSLPAISLTSSITSTDGDLRFGSGFFPVRGEFSYVYSIPDYFDDVTGAVRLDFNTGLKHRLLLQNPQTGEHFDRGTTAYVDDSARYYQVHFIYASLDFVLGLWNVDYLSSPVFSVVLSFVGDYENAYERIGWMNGDGEESTFYDAEHVNERYSSYSGVPELGHDSVTTFRQLSHTGIRVGVEFNYTEETRMTKDGVWADVGVKYMPSWALFHDRNGSSYFSVDGTAGAAYTILDISQFSLSSSSEEVLKMFTLTAQTEFNLRFVCGKGIPQYALERSVWGSHNANTLFSVANTTSLTLRGPQLTEDIYPSLSLVSDVSLSLGPVANGKGSMTCLAGSISLRAEADIFDTLYLYAECGWVYASIYEKDRGFRYSFGVRLGI